MSDAPSSPNHSFSEEEKDELTPNTKQKTKKKIGKLDMLERYSDDDDDESSDEDESGSEDGNDRRTVPAMDTEEDVDMNQEENIVNDSGDDRGDDEVLEENNRDIDKEVETR